MASVQQTVRDNAFRSRLMLAPPWAFAANNALGWVRLAMTHADVFGARRDALYALDALRPTGGYATDWKALTGPVVYAGVLLEFAPTLPHAIGDLTSLCTWFAPAVVAPRRAIESLSETRVRLSLVTMDEEWLMGTYNIVASLMQIAAVLSTRTTNAPPERDAALRFCTKCLMAAERLVASLAAIRAQAPPTMGEIAVAQAPAGAPPGPELLARHVLPTSATALAVLLAWVRAQLAECWLGRYAADADAAPHDADTLRKLVGCAFLAYGYYTEVYERIVEVSRGAADETLEAFSAGPEPLGKLRRMAAVKRHYALALAASYVATGAPAVAAVEHAAAAAALVLAREIAEARKSITKRSDILSPAQQTQLAAGCDGLQAVLDSLENAGDAPPGVEAATLEALFQHLPHLPVPSNAPDLCLDPQELLREAVGVAAEVCSRISADAVAARIVGAPGGSDGDIGALVQARVRPLLPAAATPRGALAIPPQIEHLFLERRLLFGVLRRSGLLVTKAKELSRLALDPPPGVDVPQLKRANQLLSEQLAALIAAAGAAFIPAGLNVLPAELIRLATLLADGAWEDAQREFGALVPGLNNDARADAFAAPLERAQLAIREDVIAIRSHFIV